MFSLDPIVPVYFIYGLAFFAMGFALALQSGDRIGDAVVRRGVAALATFGLIHGMHEWYEMFLIIQVRVYGYETSLTVDILRVFVLLVSFAVLCLAGCYLLCQRDGSRIRIITPYLLGLFAVGLVVMLLRLAPDWPTIVQATDAWARYSLGMTGAVLTGAGLIVRGQAYRGVSQQIVRGLVVAGGALIFYGLAGQTAPAPSVLFPSTVYNSTVFMSLFGFPVQLLRAAAAMTATIALVIALRALDTAQQRTLRAAIEAKLAAQAQAQEELAHRQALQSELLRRIVAAQEDERSRIARELHDQTGQTLTALSYRVAALGNGRAVTEEMVGGLKDLANQALADLRGLVTDLRPAQLDDLGLVAALHWMADQMHSRLDLDVEVDIEGRKQRLSREVETSLFRIAQEALTNVARHAGVDYALLRVSFTEEFVRLEIVDGGVGFDVTAARDEESKPGKKAWGIMGMDERASLVGGRLRLSSQPGEGTTVRVTVPLIGEHAHD